MHSKLKAGASIAFFLAFFTVTLPIAGQPYADNSVLHNGTWFKFRVSESGVYILDHDFLTNDLGVDEPILFSTLGIYGNGGEMLPEECSGSKNDDLVENAITINDANGNGELDQGDHIIFYAKGPHTWDFSGSDSLFRHKINLYTDYAHYFFTPDKGSGKRIQTKSITQTEDITVTNFHDRYFHELENENLDASGRMWLGEVFTVTTSVRTFEFNVPGIKTNTAAYIRSSVAAASIGANPSFIVKYGGSTLLNQSLGSITGQYTSKVASASIDDAEFYPSGSNVSFTYQYSGAVSSRAWLDYIELNCIRNLSFPGKQLEFRISDNVNPTDIVKYSIQNGTSDMLIWDVSDPLNPSKMSTSLNGSMITFKSDDAWIREFVAFRNNSSSLQRPDALGQISNQNLHGLGQSFPDMFILTVDSFINEAEVLAEHHRNEDQLGVVTIDIQHIYNEFSSGSQDITAIRNFIKMFYDLASGDPSKQPRYMLLLGDASYDYKDRIPLNTNIVPTYQSDKSLNPTTSFATDDYFGFLDDFDGGDIINDGDLLDIAIGRIPAKSSNEAKHVIDKILNYVKPHTMGAWRNTLTFVADDEDYGIHLKDADDATKKLDNKYPVYNVDKIYIDAYSQISTPGGDRYPDVNEAILNRMFTGGLIMNYTGHGGVNNWAHERIFNLSDIQTLSNFDKLPLFVTATCEFSRYDDPAKTSAGELLLLNKTGGGIALVTTVRLVYSSQNKTMSDAFYSKVFEPYDGRTPTLGEVMMSTKNSIPGTDNNRKFILLGDPALKLAYPTYDVVTTEITDQDGNPIDTLSALDRVNIRGEVRDENGVLLSQVNGTLNATVLDKKKTITTLRNDTPEEGGTKEQFEMQNSALFKGKVSVVNGEFSFSFIVPKDIDYRYGFGKISYYAQDGNIDAHGYTNTMTIGGSSDQVISDNIGPKIELYMNDEFFRNGGMTDENPVLLVNLEDESGINMTGNGIGHDITGILDNNQQNKIILNAFYEAELDDFRKGSVRYPLFDLEEGQHEILVKAWDVLNNSSEASLTFVVKPANEFVIEDIMNYPNPVFNRTAFQFEHNMPNKAMDVTVHVYSMDGTLVSTLEEKIENPGYRVTTMEWDGTTNRGVSLSKGIYLFNITVSTTSESQTSEFEKLVILQ